MFWALTLIGACAPVAAGERVPAVLLVVTQEGVERAAGASRMRGEAAAAIEARSGLAILGPDQLGVDLAVLGACPPERRLSCWARELRERGRPRPSFLFLLSVQRRDDGRSRFSMVMLDLAAAEARLAEGGDPDAIEDAVFSGAVSGDTSVVAPGPDEAAFYAAQAEIFAPALADGGAGEARGTIEVDATRAGLGLELDGRAAGVTCQGVTPLADVRAGDHVVRVLAGGEAIHEARVVLLPGGVSRVVVSVEVTSPLGHGLLWGGAGTMAAGVALAVAAVASTASRVDSRCLMRPGAEGAACDGLGWPTTSFLPEAAPTTAGAAVNGAGLALAPFGMSLFVAGAAWTAGGVFGEEPAWQWLSLPLGLALGGLVYGVAAAAGG